MFKPHKRHDINDSNWIPPIRVHKVRFLTTFANSVLSNMVFCHLAANQESKEADIGMQPPVSPVRTTNTIYKHQMLISGSIENHIFKQHM
jgi:hypothetical protein